MRLKQMVVQRVQGSIKRSVIQGRESSELGFVAL